jgi:CDP-glycerol glycerophosphotransferase (TagB/SpsB family)
VHDSLTAHLRDHPEDHLLYKRGAKGNRDYWQGSERLLALENARLVPSTASANRLIAASDVVIAFQTTALIDAMHTDKVLIYCAWGDRYEELKGGLIDFEGFARVGAILHARSPAELRQFLALQPREVKMDLAARKRIRESFTANPDGMVASRFADWLSARIGAN